MILSSRLGGSEIIAEEIPGRGSYYSCKVTVRGDCPVNKKPKPLRRGKAEETFFSGEQKKAFRKEAFKRS